jgi:hypothetical protein
MIKILNELNIPKAIVLAAFILAAAWVSAPPMVLTQNWKVKDDESH